MTRALLRRLVLTFTPTEGVEIRALYRTKRGHNPWTKARRWEATQLITSGLTRALEALEGRVDVVGESGYETREDVIVGEADRRRKGDAA